SELEAVISGRTSEYDVPAEALRFARLCARRRVAPEELVDTIACARQAFYSIAADIIDELDLPASEKVDIVMDMSRLLLWWSDATLAALVAEHARERTAFARDAHLRRIEVTRAIIAGESIVQSEAAIALDHPLGQWHTAAVLWTDLSAGESTGAVVRDAARRLGGQLHAQIMFLEPDAREFWLWLTTPLEPHGLNDAVRCISGWPAGIRAAVGNSELGLDGFRISHLQAKATRRTVSRLRHAGDIASYSENELAVIAGSEFDVTRRFVRRTLGPLLEGGSNAAKLRRSLRAYFDANMQISAAATELGVHSNTLRYRIQQAAEMLGRPIDNDRFRLEIALKLCHGLAL
ncbi:MAG: PucR family transcriptional regulator, partial [[Mycobacterium] stephanolepidis]